MITPLRPPATLPQSLIDAMNEADELGLKQVEGYIGGVISLIIHSAPDNSLRDLLLLEIQKRDANRLIRFEKYLLESISDNKSKGQLVQFKRKNG